jgi:O-antigen/teichoic acid export membrane protein
MPVKCRSGRSIEDLKSQTVRGSLFMGGTSVLLRGISLVSGVLLARWLDPKDFGIVALAQVLLATTGLFSGLGMAAAVIHSREDRDQDAFHALLVSVIAGALLSILLFVLADVSAELLRSADVGPVLRWMSIMVLLGALGSIPEALLEKAMMFGRVSGIIIVTDIVYVGSALLFAAFGFRYWSLVWAILLRSVVNVSLLWAFSPGWRWLRPRPIHLHVVRRLLHYGIQSTGSGLMAFFNSIVDNFIVGRELGENPLGLYSKAYDFATRTVEGFLNIIGLVLFPSYARLQDDAERLARAYLKSLRSMIAITAPLALGMFVTAPDLIPLLLGEKWVPMIAAFQVLALVNLVKPISASTGALFASTGHPGFNFRAGVLVFVLLVPLILLFLGWGIYGVAIALLITHILGLGYNVLQVRRILPAAARTMIPAVLPPIGTACAMTLLVYAARFATQAIAGPEASVTIVEAMVVTGIVSYGVLAYVFQRALVTELWSLVFVRSRR